MKAVSEHSIIHIWCNVNQRFLICLLIYYINIFLNQGAHQGHSSSYTSLYFTFGFSFNKVLLYCIFIVIMVFYWLSLNYLEISMELVSAKHCTKSSRLICKLLEKNMDYMIVRLCGAANSRLKRCCTFPFGIEKYCMRVCLL